MRNIFGALTICGLVLAPGSSWAQITPEKVGIDLMKSVISSLVGKGFESIFGGDGAVTKRQLEEVLQQKLDAYRALDVKDEIEALKNRIEDYQPLCPKTPQQAHNACMNDRSEVYSDIFRRVADLRAALDTQIMDKDGFWKFLADYILVTNVRIGFQVERRIVGNAIGADKKLADYAVDGLEKIDQYFHKRFVDRVNIECVNVGMRDTFFSLDGAPMAFKTGTPKPFEKPRGSYSYLKFNNKVSMRGRTVPVPGAGDNPRFCLDHLRGLWKARAPGIGYYYPPKLQYPGQRLSAEQINRSIFPHQAFFRAEKRPFGGDVLHRNILKRVWKGKYFFVYKGSPDENEYWTAGPFKTLEAANKRRVLISLDKYPVKLGNVKLIATAWYNIVQKTGRPDAKQKADNVARSLGLKKIAPSKVGTMLKRYRPRQK